MAIRLLHSSAQRRALLHQDEQGRAFFGSRPLFTIAPDASDRLHVVAASDRIDLLAHRYLGDANLFWVIADLNGIAHPLELPVGETLRIPAAARLTPEVLRGET